MERVSNSERTMQHRESEKKTNNINVVKYINEVRKKSIGKYPEIVIYYFNVRSTTSQIHRFYKHVLNDIFQFLV